MHFLATFIIQIIFGCSTYASLDVFTIYSLIQIWCPTQDIILSKIGKLNPSFHLPNYHIMCHFNTFGGYDSCIVC